MSVPMGVEDAAAKLDGAIAFLKLLDNAQMIGSLDTDQEFVCVEGALEKAKDARSILDALIKSGKMPNVEVPARRSRKAGAR